MNDRFLGCWLPVTNSRKRSLMYYHDTMPPWVFQWHSGICTDCGIKLASSYMRLKHNRRKSSLLYIGIALSHADEQHLLTVDTCTVCGSRQHSVCCRQGFYGCLRSFPGCRPRFDGCRRCFDGYRRQVAMAAVVSTVNKMPLIYIIWTVTLRELQSWSYVMFSLVI